jgi:trimeric autotransporter adhesin
MSRIRFLPPRGSATDHTSFTGDLGELTVDTTNYQLRIHDGTTPGGHIQGGTSTLAGCTDVNAGSPTGNDLLQYDSGSGKWINVHNLAWSKISSTPTTLSGYGITDAAPAARTITAGTGLTGGGDLSANRTLALANMATLTIKGNNTGGSAAPADLTASQVKSLLAIASGDVSGLATSATTDTTNAGNIGSGTLGAARLPALTGDVTTSVGTVATTIAAAAVTLAKMANLAANSIIGNNTGSGATPIALSISQVKTLLNYVADSNTWTGLNTISSGGLTSAAYVVFGRNSSTTDAYLGVAGATSNILTNSAQKDLCVRADTGNLLLGVSSAIVLKLTSSLVQSLQNVQINTGADASTTFLVAGTAKGVRVGTSAGAGTIAGVDNTGSGSYQPLQIAGSTLALQIASSDALDISAAKAVTLWEGTDNVGTAALMGAATKETGTYTGTLTGCTTSPTVTVRWTRVGNIVTITIPAISATSNLSTCTITGALPAGISPSTTKYVPVANFQNAGTVDGTACAAISAGSAVITFARGGSAASWTTSGIKGFSSTGSFTYDLN